MAKAGVRPPPLLIGSIGHRPVDETTGQRSSIKPTDLAMIERTAEAYEVLSARRKTVNGPMLSELPYASEWAALL